MSLIPDHIAQQLTPREIDVLHCILHGKSSRTIAAQLGVSFKTIDAHRSKISKKLKVDCVAALIRKVAVESVTSSSVSPITLYIDPGDAPAELIGELFVSLSAIYAAHGGSGLRVAQDERRVLIAEEVD